MDMLRSMKLRRSNASNQKHVSTKNESFLKSGSTLSTSTASVSVDVFQSHWRRALAIMKQTATATGNASLGGKGAAGHCCPSSDDVTIVVQNVGRMCELLVNEEEEENGQQGDCLVHLLAEDILDQLVTWCLQSGVYENKIKYELLKILENMISQSLQPLLYHKPVIRPLLALLGSCANTGLAEIENHVILLLHQLCVCISRNPQRCDPSSISNKYLELFFNVSYSSGQNNFLIFCLLIPYIHREGVLGQQARDALLLIMAASARNQVIGKYIANNSDFCPVLATGLSALYSSLPHKVRPEGHEDWYRIEKDHYMDMPDVLMIINCLEFCNAVVQVAHELVGQQLIDYIYNGFLLPVMAPALLQNAIEEQVSAIAYLELFVRTVTEPSLLRAFLHFILIAKHDDVIILEWLIDRINSSTKLCMVSLSLFKTLIELNCEDVMFGLCFKYLFRLTHVMQSQKRAIKQVDIYGNIAERLLQLEPVCCQHTLSEEQQKLLVSYNEGFSMGSEFDLLSNLPFNFGFGNNRSGLLSIFSSGHSTTASSLEEYKSSYMDYLATARQAILSCSKSCSSWCYIYNGEIPPYNTSIESSSPKTKVRAGRSASVNSTNKYDTPTADAASLEDDVPLLSLSGLPPPSSSSRVLDDSVLIDITTEDSQGAVTRDNDSKLIGEFSPDDVPLCIAHGGKNCDTVSANQGGQLLDLADEPLGMIDLQQNLTLNLLLQNQNQAISGTVSPPALPAGTFGTVSPPALPAGTLPLLSSAPKLSCSLVNEDHESKPFECFLSYLDDSIDHVTVDPEKSGSELLQEVDSLIEKAELRVQKRKESRLSSRSPDERLNSFAIGSSVSEGLSSLQSHPVDVGPQVNRNVDPRPRRRVLGDYSLKLDDSVDSTPTIGPFLITLLSKLENMMNNSLSVNLLLTGVVTRIASYPQPLLRSFLLNHSLVFQPSIKSLVQVLTSVRSKVDAFAGKVPNFSVLLLQARKIMMERADTMDLDGEGHESSGRQQAASMMSHGSGDREADIIRSPGKRITDFFRRDKQAKSVLHPELVLESHGYRFTNAKQAEKVKFESAEARLATMNTKKAVYCALVLEEFVKELAALSQEHAIHSDEGYQTE